MRHGLLDTMAHEDMTRRGPMNLLYASDRNKLLNFFGNAKRRSARSIYLFICPLFFLFSEKTKDYTFSVSISFARPLLD